MYFAPFITEKPFLCNLVPRLFTYARRCGKDPGWGWSRDNSKFYCLRGGA